MTFTHYNANEYQHCKYFYMKSDIIVNIDNKETCRQYDRPKRNNSE